MEGQLVQTIANGLSVVTIMSCLFLKVPQIIYIREKKSAEGLYVQALLMEVTGFTVMTLYNFTNQYGIMTYLEYPIILFQVYVLLYYVLKYKKMLHLSLVPLGAIVYGATVAAFMMGLLPKWILSYVVPFCTPLSGFAKVTYIYGIAMSENADAVSLTTWIISVLTNLARVFTVYVDSTDVKLMSNFFISALLSAGVLGTALYYQNVCFDAPPRERKKPSRRRTHFD